MTLTVLWPELHKRVSYLRKARKAGRKSLESRDTSFLSSLIHSIKTLFSVHCYCELFLKSLVRFAHPIKFTAPKRETGRCSRSVLSSNRHSTEDSLSSSLLFPLFPPSFPLSVFVARVFRFPFHALIFPTPNSCPRPLF